MANGMTMSSRQSEILNVLSGFGSAIFAVSSYLNRQGHKYPFMEMNRDGFMFLVMGFTGKEAARTKEAFIEAFNMMEDKVRAFTLDERKQISDLLRANSTMLIGQDNTIRELAPKAEVHDRTMYLGDSMIMTNAAKMLGIRSRSIGPQLAHPRLHPSDPQDSWIPD